MSSNIKTKSITLVLTHQCNLACTYCYEKHKDNQRMSFDVANQIILDGMGTQFDPSLKKYYLEARPHFEEYYQSLD